MAAPFKDEHNEQLKAFLFHIDESCQNALPLLISQQNLTWDTTLFVNSWRLHSSLLVFRP